MAEEVPQEERVFKRIRTAMSNGKKTVGAADVEALCAIGMHSRQQEIRVRSTQMKKSPPPGRQYPVSEVEPLLDDIEKDYRDNPGDPEPEEIDRTPEPTVDEQAAESEWINYSKSKLLEEARARGLMANSQMRKADIVSLIQQDEQTGALDDVEDAEESSMAEPEA